MGGSTCLEDLGIKHTATCLFSAPPGEDGRMPACLPPGGGPAWAWRGSCLPAPLHLGHLEGGTAWVRPAPVSFHSTCHLLLGSGPPACLLEWVLVEGEYLWDSPAHLGGGGLGVPAFWEGYSLGRGPGRNTCLHCLGGGGGGGGRGDGEEAGGLSAILGLMPAPATACLGFSVLWVPLGLYRWGRTPGSFISLGACLMFSACLTSLFCTWEGGRGFLFWVPFTWVSHLGSGEATRFSHWNLSPGREGEVPGRRRLGHLPACTGRSGLQSWEGPATWEGECLPEGMGLGGGNGREV